LCFVVEAAACFVVDAFEQFVNRFVLWCLFACFTQRHAKFFDLSEVFVVGEDLILEPEVVE
jgi:hypothetical protein